MTKSKGLSKILLFRELGIIIVIFAIYLIVSAIQPRFFTLNSIINIMLFLPFLLIAALGEMIELISGNVDVSVGSILAFVSVTVGIVFKGNETINIFLIFIMAILLGALLGLINGIIVTGFKLPSIIVTLGTMNLYRGIIFILGRGKQIDSHYIPRSLVALSQPKESVLFIPYTVIIAFGVAILIHLFLRNTRLGREIYASGCNPEAARLKGINVKLISIIVFVISGALCGLAAIMYISRIGYINPVVAGAGLEFTAIAAIVIGGTSISGGAGSVLGTVLGCILLGVINNAIAVTGISGYWQEAIYGIIIILAITMDKFIKNKMASAAGGIEK